MYALELSPAAAVAVAAAALLLGVVLFCLRRPRHRVLLTPRATASRPGCRRLQGAHTARRWCVRCARARAGCSVALGLLPELAVSRLLAVGRVTCRCALAGPAVSSDAIARVDTLYEKASELSNKGHVLRAAEIYGRAAEAACALGADNLVLLHMNLQQSRMHFDYVTAAPKVDARTLAHHLGKYLELVASAVAALNRRRMAGTLLEGTCAAAEEEWNATKLQRFNDFPAATAASWAALVGYQEFLHGARCAVDIFTFAELFVSKCSAEQFQTFAQHIEDAAELMQQPRRYFIVGLQAELQFACVLDVAVRMPSHDARLVRVWQRLQRSGVLQLRRIDESIRLREPAQLVLRAALKDSLNAPGLRRCALPGCGVREAHPAHFKSCAACRAVVYCCREHQVDGWPAHKKACKAARKAAAAEEEDGAGPSGA